MDIIRDQYFQVNNKVVLIYGLYLYHSTIGTGAILSTKHL